ncbi:hypothetical protein K5X82_13905 [Halosquirtibacter xylanolyticus]|uniref:hypothetical protein n=1 Tax=Halosquirtibacter xylanolyticus TaxID=3374599 RepID=UPI003748BBEC|nr:hypothetical protein K5X82_13905 [Prolixibacteraceae bacterium]
MKISNKIAQKSLYGLFRGTMFVYLMVSLMFLLFHQYTYMIWVAVLFVSDIFLYFYMEPDQIDLFVHEDSVEVAQKESFKKDVREYRLDNHTIKNILIKNHLFGIKTMLWFQIEGDDAHYYINLTFFDPACRDKIIQTFLLQLTKK